MGARRRPSRDLQVYGALALQQVVLADEPLLQRSDRIQVQPGIDAKFPEPASEASSMSLPLEEPAANDPSHFIDAVAEEEAALINREFGFVARQELAVRADGQTGRRADEWLHPTSANRHPPST
jgi:hypothetical protein